jgi:uncharacterized protein YraI
MTIHSMKRLLAPGLAALAFAVPLAAQAQQAHTAKWVNLRAGPARDYPLVASFPPGVPIAVQGCVVGYSWCDVIGPSGERGWIYAGNIVYPYQTGDVPVIQYGAVIGFPIVTFVIGSYWGDYYRGRPWYGNMQHWHNHRPPAWRPPPPRPPGVRPPPPPGPRPPSVRPPERPRPPPPSVRPPPRPQPQPPVAGPRPPGDRPGVGRPPPPRPGGGNRPGGDERPQPR